MPQIVPFAIKVWPLEGELEAETNIKMTIMARRRLCVLKAPAHAVVEAASKDKKLAGEILTDIADL